MSIVGLDLAGVESRPTGLCVLRDMKAETSLVYTDEEVLEKTEESKPKIVARARALSSIDPRGQSQVKDPFFCDLGFRRQEEVLKSFKRLTQ